MSHPYLVLRFCLDGVVTVVDAINGAATLDAFPEAQKQVAVADRLMLSKTDLLDGKDQYQQFAHFRAQLTSLNPTAQVLDNVDEFDISRIFDAGLYNPVTKSPDVARWLNAEKLICESREGHEGHPAHDHVRQHGETSPGRGDVSRHGAISSFCLVSDEPLTTAGCDLFLEMLRIAHGPNLLRVKGVIALSDDLLRPLVVHGVQHVFHPPVRLQAWPDADRRTRIVFIVKDLDARFLEGLYAAFAGRVQADRPDAQALTANPLQLTPGGLLS